jgi:SAM-dependent methyltransferase
MFHNLVNIHDAAALGRAVFSGRIWSLVSRLGRGHDAQVAAVWQSVAGPPSNWWDLPAVRARWNLLISGDPNLGHQAYVAAKYLGDRSGLVALSLGCGSGGREASWAETGKFRRITGIDLSAPRIEAAHRAARAKGLEQILDYRVGNAMHIDAAAAEYDVVLAEGSLHHLSPLHQVLENVRRALKPDGLFIVNEFVGPTRFQWTDRQLEVVNSLLQVLPARYRRWHHGRGTRDAMFRPSRLSMIYTDPSEAIESGRILSELGQRFDVVELKPYGGTILHLLLHGIAGNFLADDPLAERWLRLCFEVEDCLLASGELDSDYAFAVCRPRGDGGS